MFNYKRGVYYSPDNSSNFLAVLGPEGRGMLAEGALTSRPSRINPLGYLTYVFRQLMTGNKDTESLLPAQLTPCNDLIKRKL